MKFEICAQIFQLPIFVEPQRMKTKSSATGYIGEWEFGSKYVHYISYRELEEQGILVYSYK